MEALILCCGLIVEANGRSQKSCFFWMLKFSSEIEAVKAAASELEDFDEDKEDEEDEEDEEEEEEVPC